MAYEKPSCSFNAIDKACKIIVEGHKHIEDLDEQIAEIRRGLNLLSNWRAAHRYPLNCLHMTLRNRAKRIEKTSVTAQRLKRYESVLRKLQRQTTMQMSQMQDVGGCRAIMSGMKSLNALDRYYQTKPLTHILVKRDDYISNPKPDGYRSIHYRYRFVGRASSSHWNKLRIEIQMRTKLQHAWATAVETTDIFTGEGLKLGLGGEKWRRFFALMGSVIAHYEGTSRVPETPNDIDELRQEIETLEKDLQVIFSLQSYAAVGKSIEGRNKQDTEWYLLETRPAESKVVAKAYQKNQAAQAKDDYQRAEERNLNTRNQSVLVSVNSFKDLQKAYPNYFADTTLFVATLKRFLAGPLPRK